MFTPSLGGRLRQSRQTVYLAWQTYYSLTVRFSHEEWALYGTVAVDCSTLTQIIS